MRNSISGKTMENLRNKIDVRFVSNRKDCLKWTSKPSYISQNLFDNDLVVILGIPFDTLLSPSFKMTTSFANI